MRQSRNIFSIFFNVKIAPGQGAHRDILSIFFNVKVCCVFSLESPNPGHSNGYKQYTIFNIKKKITLNYPKSSAMGFCSKGLKNKLETAVLNEPTMFEPLKLYRTCINLPFCLA